MKLILIAPDQTIEGHFESSQALSEYLMELEDISEKVDLLAADLLVKGIVPNDDWFNSNISQAVARGLGYRIFEQKNGIKTELL
jgi:hypothetical protein